MADIGTAYIRIAPNMSGIQGKISSGLRGAGTPAGAALGEEIGSGASAKMAALSGVIAGATAAIVNKGIEVASGAIKDFISSASEIQSLRASFESLTGSVDATNKVMNTLYEFGKHTAFSNQDIQSAGRSFLAVGQNADQMQKSLQMAGDIAGATGANLGQLVLPLTQAYARGTLQTQDFYQILNSGAGALRGTLQQVVAAKTGITNLGDAMSQGKVTSDLLWQAMQIATAQGGFAFGGAQKQAETFNGRMSNLKEAITQAGLGMLGVNAATGEIDKNGIFAKFSNTVQNLVNTLSGADFQAKMKNISAGIQSAISSVAGVVSFIVRNRDIFLPIAVGIGAIVAAMKIWQIVTKAMIAAQIAFNIVMDANPISLIILAIIGLVAGLTIFFTKTQTGKKLFQEFGQVLSAVWDGIKTGFQAVVNFFTSAWQTINGGLQAVGGFFTGIWNSIMSGVNAFLAFFGAHWRIIIAIVLGPLGLLIDFVTAYWSQITGAISTAVNAIWGVITSVFNAIAGFIRTIWNIYWGIISGVANAIWGVVTSVFNTIKNFLGAVFSPIIGVFSSIWNTLWGVISGAGSRIWSAITGTFNSVIGFLGGIGSRIIGIFSGAGSWLYNAGVNMIQGMINGAGSLLSKIGSFFLNMIPGWIVGPFKKALGIHSPSKVFAGMGGNITQGLVNGIAGGVGDVRDAMGNVTDAALAPINGGVIDPTIGIGAASSASPGSGNAGMTNQTVSIGEIHLGDQSAVQEFFRQLNQDTMRVGMGLTPNQGALKT